MDRDLAESAVAVAIGHDRRNDAFASRIGCRFFSQVLFGYALNRLCISVEQTPGTGRDGVDRRGGHLCGSAADGGDGASGRAVTITQGVSTTTARPNTGSSSSGSTSRLPHRRPGTRSSSRSSWTRRCWRRQVSRSTTSPSTGTARRSQTAPRSTRTLRRLRIRASPRGRRRATGTARSSSAAPPRASGSSASCTTPRRRWPRCADARRPARRASLKGPGDALRKVQAGIAKLPRDRQGALGEFEGAVGDLEAALESNPSASPQLMPIIVEIAGTARQVALAARQQAGDRGGNAAKIAEATSAIASGDALWASDRFKDAVAKYKDAVSKAEGA